METIGVTSVSFSNNNFLVKKIKKKFPRAKIYLAKKKLSKLQLIKMISRCTKLIVGLDKINKENLAVSKKLKIISKYGVGLDNIDISECKRRFIKVNCTKGVNKRSVSELVLSSSIFLSRNLYKSNNLLKTGHWISKGGNDLSGKKFGIIGFGNIGKDLARLLGPFKCKIYYNDIINIKNVNKNYIKKNKKYIFKNCDFISIHVPYNNNTKNMITKRILKQSKKDLIIINTSRGGVVNEKDILYALRNNKIKGAVLDVFSKEPFIKKSVLNIKNLIAFPHIGGASEESIKKMGLAAIANLT